MKKTCISCTYWTEGHDGVWDEDSYGTCKLLTSNEATGFKKIIPLVEGCVSVHARVSDFEFVTGKDFGCVNFKAN